MDNYHDKMTKLLPGDDTISLKDSQVSPCLILSQWSNNLLQSIHDKGK